MGHTHYNELGNDGQTIYATIRSTGQIEKGPVGFSILALDHGVTSWRFKTLAHPWPLVMITSPADRRLRIGPNRPDSLARAEVRAHAWSGCGILSAECQIDDGPWRPMHAQVEERCWRLECDVPAEGFRLTVRAMDGRGNRDEDRIEVEAADGVRTTRHADGSDRDSVVAWSERQVFGTQLGPNRNGRKW